MDLENGLLYILTPRSEHITINYCRPTTSQDISKLVQHYKTYHQPKDPNIGIPLKIGTTPTHRNTRLYMDVMGPLTTRRGRKHILAITNTFTRYTELVEIPNKETVTVTQALLDQWILRHGFYEQVVSDHGGEFVSEVMDNLNRILKTKHREIVLYSSHTREQAR